ncbi:MAG: xanthine dehydrogenase family protein molybdopterin-binding subunit [Dehalococcoidales bacterium]
MAKLIKSKLNWEGTIFERVSVVGDEEPAAWPAGEQLNYVGKSYPRVDEFQRVTGLAKYTFDIQLPGMLYARVLRSPYPHARVKQIDVSKAQEFPGVRAVISSRNDGDVFSNVLQFAGDEVAALAADNNDIAEDAISLIKVEYEILPFNTDTEPHPVSGKPQDSQTAAPLDGHPKIYRRGNIQKGFQEADVIVEETFRTQSALHNCLETHGSVASWKGDELTVWESTQSIYNVQRYMAEYFKLPLNKIRVICEYMGGGFGSKQSSGKWSLMAALLACETGRPVQLMLTREEENLVTGHRAPTIQKLKLGAKNDGTLTAIDLIATVNVGANGSMARVVAGPCQSMYNCPNVQTELHSVFTNTGPHGSFRAPGYVEGAFPLESLMDELAKRLKIDPMDIRMKNYALTDPATGQKFSAKHLDKCYQRGAEIIGWKQRQTPNDKNQVLRHGYGMASQTWGGGGGPPAFAWVRLNSDGTAEVNPGSQDIGTGVKTVFAQIAAEELGLELDKIVVHIGDTAQGPFGPGSGGSMTLASIGPAVRQAAIDARKQLYEVISGYFDVPADQIQIKQGHVYVPGETKPHMSLQNTLRQLGEFTIIGRGARGPNPDGIAVPTFGAQFAEVEVNTITGEVKVQRLVAVHDVGRIMNPAVANGQVAGGVIQGVGYALTEERIIDRATGIILNPNLEDYALPTALDVPAIDSNFIDDSDNEANNTGAKGLGEPPIIPTAPAIANAIAQAIGVRFLSLPITRAKIVEALQTTGIAGGVYP